MSDCTLGLSRKKCTLSKKTSTTCLFPFPNWQVESTAAGSGPAVGAAVAGSDSTDGVTAAPAGAPEPATAGDIAMSVPAATRTAAPNFTFPKNRTESP